MRLRLVERVPGWFAALTGWPASAEPATAASPLLTALYGMLGTGLGLLLRHTTAALGLALMWAFVIEGIIPALIRAPVIIRWLPEAAANAVLHGASPTATALSASPALAVLAGYAAVLAGAGAALTAGERSAPPTADQPAKGRVRAVREIISADHPARPRQPISRIWALRVSVTSPSWLAT